MGGPLKSPRRRAEATRRETLAYVCRKCDDRTCGSDGTAPGDGRCSDPETLTRTLTTRLLHDVTAAIRSGEGDDATVRRLLALERGVSKGARRYQRSLTLLQCTAWYSTRTARPVCRRPCRSRGSMICGTDNAAAATALAAAAAATPITHTARGTVGGTFGVRWTLGGRCRRRRRR